MANTTTPPVAPPRSGRPSRGLLLRWGGVVLSLHLVILLSMAGALDWQLKNSPIQSTGPLQTHTIAGTNKALLAKQGNAPARTATPAPHTRIAIEKVKPRPVLTLQNHPVPTASAPPLAKAVTALEMPTGTTTPRPDPEPATNTAPETGAPVVTETIAPSAPAKGTHSTALAELQPSTDKTPSPDENSPAHAVRTPKPESPPPAEPVAVTHPASPALPAVQELVAAPSTATTASPDTTTAPAPNTPTAPLARATLELPSLPLAAIPPSALLSYRLQGQEKGLNYSASGELRWQRNDSAYAMSLSVKALLLGSRHWRSQGLVTPEGLAPVKYSDSWRSERAAHFDRPNQRIVFSSNAPTVPLQAGAQDQVSLYVQLAAAMAQQSTPLPVGTRLQIQTVTVRDALPWLLTLEKTETLQLNGSPLQTTLWVCQPRNRFDARVEFWVAAEHDWLPARIRITQTTGSFIDLQLTARSPLPDLPPTQPPS